MPSRRSLILSAPLLGLAASRAPALAQEAGFANFVAGIKADARRAGVSSGTLDRAFADVHPNQRVIELDRKQPEYTMTWAQYRDSRVSEKRVNEGRAAYARNAQVLAAIEQRYGVDPRIPVAIWGMESNYGSFTGTYNVIEALATLAWEGRRAQFFRTQLIDALRILERGDIQPGQMTGSWAGAMGQPQFMPNSYLSYAVDFDGDGRRDIWQSRADVLASIANYLARNGWQAGVPWGQPVQVPGGMGAETGRSVRRSLGEWMRLGVRRPDGTAFTRQDVQGAVVQPDGPGSDAFMVYANYNAIRRYNPSDLYSLGVGLLSDAVA